jgi:hypothetical protein
MLRSTKPPKCKHCRRRTDDLRKVLHDECQDAWIAGQLAKQRVTKERAAKRAKQRERAHDRQRREKLKPISEWEDECCRIVQKIARIRDKDDGCISCHMGPNYGGQWHGSHYRSVGACSNTQFLLWNIHKACAQCNYAKSGNREGYRPRLIEKIGLERVEWLDAQNQVTKRSGPAYVEYLKRFKKVMGKRLRRMERRIT